MRGSTVRGVEAARPARFRLETLRSWLASDLGLFLIALVIRLGISVLYAPDHVELAGLELGSLSDNILAGRGFTWDFYGTDVPRTSFFPPFYPAFLALLKAAFGHDSWVPAMQVIQAIPSAATAVLARRIATVLFDRGESSATGVSPSPRVLALAAGYAVAFWPPLAVYSSAAYSTTFEVFAATWAVWLLLRAGRSRRLSDAVRAGAVYGIVGTMLPAFLGTLLFVPVALRMMRVPWRRAVWMSGAVLIVALVVLLPWTVRNARIHHRFIPVATNIGFNFLGGQIPQGGLMQNLLCYDDEVRWRLIDRQALETMNEADFDRMLFAKGLQLMRENPGFTARRAMERLLCLWWGNPMLAGYVPGVGRAYMAVMTVVLLFFLIGLVYSFRFRDRFAIPYAVFLWQSLFYMNFAMRGRYAMPMYPLLLIVAVLGVGVVVRRRR